MKKIVPSLEIVAFSEDLYSKQFNDRFFMQFDIVISALDSIKVREYLAMQATRNGKPLIDAGTMSYNGQAYASLRFKTTCHNCQPSRVDT
jgi:ubiquitin-like 1-activating enzyme E1 B